MLVHPSPKNAIQHKLVHQVRRTKLFKTKKHLQFVNAHNFEWGICGELNSVITRTTMPQVMEIGKAGNADFAKLRSRRVDPRPNCHRWYAQPVIPHTRIFIQRIKNKHFAKHTIMDL